jgi:REP element-mobilizing transposase RayT
MKQLSFEKNRAFQDFKKRAVHGGGIRAGKRKLSRPFIPGQPLHVVLRSSKARGDWSLLKKKNENSVSRIIYAHAERNGVDIYQYANGGNHLHVLLKCKSKKRFQAFLKSATGLIARHVLNAKKGRKQGKFWDGLAYSKLVFWGKQFKAAKNYVLKNMLEGWGVIPPRTSARGHIRLDFQAIADE